MAEERERDPAADECAGPDDPVGEPRTILGTHKQETADHLHHEEHHLKHEDGRSLQKVWEASKSYLIRLRDAGPEKHIDLLLALAIAFFAGRQYSIMKSSSESSTDQLKQIITAADRIDDAADSFSSSAAGINRGVENAVGRLNEQASQLKGNVVQTGRLADETGEANANVIAADRPWMGGSLQSVTDFEKGKKPSFTVTFTNSGKRPAKVTFSGIRENWYPSFPADPDKEYTGQPGEEPSTSILVPGQTTLVPSAFDAPMPDPLWAIGDRPNAPITFFVFAKIEYTDLRTNRQHWTHVCFRYYPNFKTKSDFGFRNCKEYNEVDLNP